MKIGILYGTRPECIKCAPIIHEAQKRDCELTIISTMQHPDLLPECERLFDISPNKIFRTPKAGRSLNEMIADTLYQFESICLSQSFDYILVQGDTVSAMAGGLAASMRHIPLIHIEAGLRSRNKYSPFPEEINRSILSRIADIHFAPTELAAENLRNEGITSRVKVVGNTGIDAMRIISERIGIDWEKKEKQIMVTCNRRESLNGGIERICEAIVAINQRYPDHRLCWPIHPNPDICQRIDTILSSVSHSIDRVPELDYQTMLKELAKSRLLLTDSGGLQEEAPSFHVPVLVLRDVTERQEGIDAGAAELVGTTTDKIIAAADRYLTMDESTKYHIKNPYGDGYAAQRIMDDILK